MHLVILQKKWMQKRHATVKRQHSARYLAGRFCSKDACITDTVAPSDYVTLALTKSGPDEKRMTVTVDLQPTKLICMQGVCLVATEHVQR